MPALDEETDGLGANRAHMCLLKEYKIEVNCKDIGLGPRLPRLGYYTLSYVVVYESPYPILAAKKARGRYIYSFLFRLTILTITYIVPALHRRHNSSSP